MNPGDHSHDDEFDAFLRRRAPVFRRPDDGLEPPPELDRIVLRQAREAIEAPGAERVYRSPRWAAPMALAATVLLAFTVVLNIGLPDKVGAPQVSVHAVAQTTEIPGEQASANAEPLAGDAAATPTQTAEQPVTVTLIESEYAPAPAMTRDADRSTRQTAPPAPLPLPSAPPPTSAALAANAAPEAAAAHQASADAAEKRAVAADHADARATIEVRREDAPLDPDSLGPRGAGTASAAATPARSYEAPIPTPAIAGNLRREVGDSVQTASTAKSEAALPGNEDTAAEERATQPRFRRSAKSWAAEIERLREAGEHERADAELAEFRRRYPRYGSEPGAPDR